jgi:hypothetical protein
VSQSATAPRTPPPAEIVAAPSPSPPEIAATPAGAVGEPGTPAPELFAAPSPTPELTVAAMSLTAELAVEQVVERASLPPEARLLARTMRPTLTAEYEDGYWVVAAGTLGRWRVNDATWEVEPADGVAQLWEIQSRLDLR